MQEPRTGMAAACPTHASRNIVRTQVAMTSTYCEDPPINSGGVEAHKDQARKRPAACGALFCNECRKSIIDRVLVLKSPPSSATLLPLPSSTPCTLVCRAFPKTINQLSRGPHSISS
jgi:hypothetical protein